MRTRLITAAAVSGILLLTLAGCSSSGDAKPAKTVTPTHAAPAAAPAADTKDLAPIWTPKLDAAAGANAEATGACQAPSSSECARYIKEIMAVVDDVDTAITETGKRYPQSTAQIVKMRDAEKVYTDEGCEGDPAGDTTGACSGAVTITVGAATLGMTLMTDDYSS